MARRLRRYQRYAGIRGEFHCAVKYNLPAEHYNK